MEKYDVSAHLPQQIEIMLMGYDQGKADVIERCIKTISMIIPETDKIFHEGYSKLDGVRKSEMGKVRDKYVLDLQSLKNSLNLDEVFFKVNEAKAHCAEEINSIHNEFFETVISFIVDYVKQ